MTGCTNFYCGCEVLAELTCTGISVEGYANLMECSMCLNEPACVCVRVCVCESGHVWRRCIAAIIAVI